MALIRKWDGIGVSDGVLGSKAGVADNAFDATNASPVVSGECIVKANNTQHRWSWTGLNLGNIAIRFYLTLRGAPGGTSTLMEARDGSNRIFGLSINTSLQVGLRNSSNSAVYTSGALTLGRLYRIDLWKSSGNNTVQARILDVANGSEMSGSGSPGSASNVTVIEFGQISGTNSGIQRYSHMRVEDTASRIGEYVTEEGDFDTAFTRYGSASSSSGHTIPLPSTAYGDLLVMVARSGSSTAPSVPSGWESGVGHAAVGERVMWRFADGTEASSLSLGISGGGSHCAAVVYRIRSSVSIKGVGTTSDTFDPPSLSTTSEWSGERNLWLYAATWVNSNAGPTIMPDEIDTMIPMLSGSAAGRPAVVLGERRWTGNTLDIGAATSTGTVSSQRASAIVVKFDVPVEPEEPEGDANLDWFVWDGESLTPVDLLGIYEGGD